MWIFLAILVVVVGFIVYMVKGVRKSKKRFKELGGLHMWIMEHSKGLPLPSNAAVELIVCSDKIVLDSKKNSFEIPNERIKRYNVLLSTNSLFIDYLDRNQEHKSITLRSSMFDLNLIVKEATAALNRPENATVITENGSISL